MDPLIVAIRLAEQVDRRVPVDRRLQLRHHELDDVVTHSRLIVGQDTPIAEVHQVAPDVVQRQPAGPARYRLETRVQTAQRIHDRVPEVPHEPEHELRRCGP